MKTNKPRLKLKPVTPSSFEGQMEEAESYFTSEPSPYEAGRKTHALAYFNDAPGGIGGGTKCVVWFNTQEELLEVLANYLLLTNPGPYSTDYPVISRKICEAVENHHQGDSSACSLVDRVNSVTRGCFQVEWIGTRDGLFNGMEEFPRNLRKSWRGAGCEGEAPLGSDEFEPLLEYLSCGYMC